MTLDITLPESEAPVRHESGPTFEPAALHRIAAVLALDVVGYTRLMAVDESRTHARYTSHRRELIDAKVAEHRGRIVKSMGDGVLAEFQNVHDAVRCGLEVQWGMAYRNVGEPRDQRIIFRIGLSHGQIIVESDDIYGDEVNVAARLQTLAPPGGIAMSAKVVELIKHSLSLKLEDFGLQQIKNMDRPIHTFRYHGPAC